MFSALQFECFFKGSSICDETKTSSYKLVYVTAHSNLENEKMTLPGILLLPNWPIWCEHSLGVSQHDQSFYREDWKKSQNVVWWLHWISQIVELYGMYVLIGTPMKKCWESLGKTIKWWHNLRSERLLHSIVVEKIILATEPRMLPRLKKVIVFEDPFKWGRPAKSYESKSYLVNFNIVTGTSLKWGNRKR